MAKSLSSLVTGTYRDLADETHNVFTLDQVEDFIRAGVAELNRIAPLETYDDITLVAGTADYPTDIVLPYAVRLMSPDGVRLGDLVQTNDFDQISYGWNHRVTGSTASIEIPMNMANWAAALDDPPTLRVYGYSNRDMPYRTQLTPGPPPTYDDPQVAVGEDDAFSVREYAKAQGYDMLAHDRSLFAQWQGQSNNTDVSPVMMMNMAAQAQSTWHSRSRLVTTIRRYW
jgi:hypothetical protein